MSYANPLDLARVAAQGWDEIAQRAARNAKVSGTLLKAVYEGNPSPAATAEAIALAQLALTDVLDVLERTSRAADTYLAPRYQAVMPLSEELIASSDLPSAVATMALRRLYGTAMSADMERNTKWAETYLRDLGSGKASLGVADTATAAVPGRMQVKAANKMDWSGY